MYKCPSIQKALDKNKDIRQKEITGFSAFTLNNDTNVREVGKVHKFPQEILFFCQS
jgi:hypothetical protein